MAKCTSQNSLPAWAAYYLHINHCCHISYTDKELFLNKYSQVYERKTVSAVLLTTFCVWLIQQVLFPFCQNKRKSFVTFGTWAMITADFMISAVTDKPGFFSFTGCITSCFGLNSFSLNYYGNKCQCVQRDLMLMVWKRFSSLLLQNSLYSLFQWQEKVVVSSEVTTLHWNNWKLKTHDSTYRIARMDIETLLPDRDLKSLGFYGNFWRVFLQQQPGMLCNSVKHSSFTTQARPYTYGKHHTLSAKVSDTSQISAVLFSF